MAEALRKSCSWNNRFSATRTSAPLRPASTESGSATGLGDAIARGTGTAAAEVRPAVRTSTGVATGAGVVNGSITGCFGWGVAQAATSTRQLSDRHAHFTQRA